MRERRREDGGKGAEDVGVEPGCKADKGGEMARVTSVLDSGHWVERQVGAVRGR
jgi:hypothetical protein